MVSNNKDKEPSEEGRMKPEAEEWGNNSKSWDSPSDILLNRVEHNSELIRNLTYEIDELKELVKKLIKNSPPPRDDEGSQKGEPRGPEVEPASWAAPKAGCAAFADACKGYNHNESFIKTACQHLLLLVGFDTLIYRKYYDTPPILMGHQAATKLKHYFEEHPMKVVSEAPISDIMCNKDASGRIAKWAIQISPYVPVYERRDAIKSQALADFLVDWAEMQYKPPEQIQYWKMHFDGSKLKEGLGAGVVLTSPKGDHLRYVLQVHFRASNNVAEYEALIHGLKVAKEIGAHRIICYGDSDLVVQQCSGDWDAKDANMASYRFHVQKIADFFEGCEFHHVPRAENEAADALSKLGSSRQEIPPGVALAHLRVPSIKPSPESESIFVPESHVVPMDIDEGSRDYSRQTGNCQI
ncbi:hypothetical protein QYE76_025656 [Lolium multiflorum]|uniref:RNase H type-1 domain-containing protein n=1 Tax=Lolium multiflorum TaxID=4521 RepID=A0AAD8RH77_LOLMU|nr:hypothetical protein QYE76_025656 [Lolium multiflorum]